MCGYSSFIEKNPQLISLEVNAYQRYKAGNGRGRGQVVEQLEEGEVEVNGGGHTTLTTQM